MIDHQMGNNGGKSFYITNIFICKTSHENLTLLSAKHNVCMLGKWKKDWRTEDKHNMPLPRPGAA